MSRKEDLLALEKELRELDRRQREFKLEFYKPYPKQQDFHDLGFTKRERMLRAGNRVGKTYCGAAELAMHLTGLYPDWWLGRRWDRPIRAWTAGKTGLETRKINQRALCGDPGVVKAQGTGMIPKHCVDWKDTGTSLARGVTDLYDTVWVTHHTDGKPDGLSMLQFLSYDQGREKWQGDSLDVIWMDEEAPMEIYSEGLTRIGERDGMVFTTFTPMLGKTELLIRFQDEVSPDRALVSMTLYDAQHIAPNVRQKMIDGYPAHEREARVNGVAMQGEGRVFELLEESITCKAFDIPKHWALLWGLDFGMAHPFAAALLAHDRDADVVYIIATIRMKDKRPLDHAQAMKPVLNGYGFKIPAAWPQDGTQRKEFEGSLVPTADIYRKHGINMQHHHAVFKDGSNSTEAGIQHMIERMTTNRFKVFSHLVDWFEEFRDYHREDGQLVKVRDDLMSATRVGIMQLRSAKPVLNFTWDGQKANNSGFAKGLDALLDW